MSMMMSCVAILIVPLALLDVEQQVDPSFGFDACAAEPAAAGAGLTVACCPDTPAPEP